MLEAATLENAQYIINQQQRVLEIALEAIAGALDQPETPEAYDAMINRLQNAFDALSQNIKNCVALT